MQKTKEIKNYSKQKLINKKRLNVITYGYEV